MRTFFAPDPETTRALGERLGTIAGPGTVVALIGDLGSGKTIFAKGVGMGLGVDHIQSPTYVIVQAHEGGRFPLWHADLYRLEHAHDLAQLGIEDLLEGEGIALIEWADLHPSILPADHLVVSLEEEDAGRRITVVGRGPRSVALEDALGG